MARPKRQRSEAPAALVTLAPTTRRRRSQAGYEPTPIDSEAVAPKLTRAISKREANANHTKKIAAVNSSRNDKSKDDSTATTDDMGNDHAVDEGESIKASTSQVEQNRMQVDEQKATSAATKPEDTDAKDPPQQPRTEPMEASTDRAEEVSLPSIELSTATSGDDATKDRIRRVLEHRKVLLQRVIQSRNAAQKRLSLVEGDAASITDEQETLEFAETMKKVSALARKQAQAENSAAAASSNSEPRRSLVSLRRGNSVGKRMNAAISTLMGIASNNAAADDPSAPSFSGVLPMKLVNVMASETNGENISSARSVVPPHHSLSTVSTIKSIKRSDASSLGRSALKKSHSSAGRSGDTVMQLLSSSHKSVHPPPPLHQLGMHPPRRIVPHASPPPPPRIICPETAALRRRRDQIRSQLTHLIQNRSTTQLPEGGEQPPIRITEPRAVTTPSRRMRSSAAAKSTTPIWQGPELPPELPPRRKTHWDVVLEEMRWMATDYLEERKWKLATARVLARQLAHDALQKHAHSASPDSPPPSALKAAPLQKEVLVPNLDTLSMEGIPLIRNGSTVSSSSTSLKVVDLDSNVGAQGQHFHKLSTEDECIARTIAKQISLLVSAVVASNNAMGSLTPTIEPTEYQKSVWTDGSEMVPLAKSSLSAIQSSQSAVDPTFDATAEKDEMFVRASNHVDRVMRLLANEAHDAKKFLDKTEEMNGIQLSMEQKGAMEIIEDRWNRIGIGAVLHGSLASGKTFAACALLCRNRKHGPQLLVCSSSNMVRCDSETVTSLLSTANHCRSY
jgi:HSA